MEYKVCLTLTHEQMANAVRNYAMDEMGMLELGKANLIDLHYGKDSVRAVVTIVKES